MIPMERPGRDPVMVLQRKAMWGINKVSQIVIDSATFPSRVCVVAGAASKQRQGA